MDVPVVLNAQHYLSSLRVSHTTDGRVALLPHSVVSATGVHAMAKFHLSQCFRTDSSAIPQLCASCPPLHRCVTPEMAVMLCGPQDMPQLAQVACSLWGERFCSAPLDGVQGTDECLEERPRKILRSEPRALDIDVGNKDKPSGGTVECSGTVDSGVCTVDTKRSPLCSPVQFHRMMCRTVLTLMDNKCSPIVGASLDAHLPAADGRGQTMTRFSLFDRKTSAHPLCFQFELVSSAEGSAEPVALRCATQVPHLQLLSDDALQRSFAAFVITPLSRAWTEQDMDTSAFVKFSTQRFIAYLSWLSHRCRSQLVLSQLRQREFLCDVVTSLEPNQGESSAHVNETVLRCANGDSEQCLQISVKGVEDTCRWRTCVKSQSSMPLTPPATSYQSEGPLQSLLAALVEY